MTSQIEKGLVPAGIVELVERNAAYDDSAGVSTRMGDLRAVVAALTSTGESKTPAAAELLQLRILALSEGKTSAKKSFAIDELKFVLSRLTGESKTESSPEVTEAAFIAGFEAGEAAGKFEDDTCKDAWGRYRSARLTAALSVGREGAAQGKTRKIDPGAIRICPMRDGPCPHGMGCEYVGESHYGYPCKPGWNGRLALSPEGQK